MLGTRGVVRDKWSQRILWFRAIGSALSMFYSTIYTLLVWALHGGCREGGTGPERMMAEGLKDMHGASGQFGEDV